MKKWAASLIGMIVFLNCITFNVFASTTKTSAEALSWVRSKSGTKVGSGQCVALISAYYNYLGFSSVSGNGCDYATNTIPSGLGWREKGGVPQPGDILIYTGSTYGHVAIHESDNVSWHQNWGGLYVEKVSRNYKTSFSYQGQMNYYWGCIHVNFADAGLGNPVDLGTDFYAYIINTKAWKPIASDNSGNVVLETETGQPNQMWKFERLSDGSYKIISLKDGKCLDTHNFGTTSGTNVQTCVGNGSTAQKWFIYGSSGEYKLKSQCTECVMDVTNSNFDDGTNIQMWEYNSTDAQKFQIYKVDSVFALGKPVDLGDEFYAYIMNKKAWKPIAADDSNNVILQTETGELNQVWKFKKIEDGSYQIISLKDGNCLDVDMAGTTSGTNVKTCYSNGGSAQRWYVYGNENNYKLKAQCTGCILDVSNGGNSDGTNIQMWEYNDTDAQKFQIYKLDVGMPEIDSIVVDSDNISIELSKYSIGHDIIVAFYDDAGKIVDVQHKDTTAKQREYKFTFRKNNICSIDAFVWDSIKNMIPICESRALKLD